jgi:NAD(P)-dependent dehydrogenase (short-subunit alcohol dehydrogenase family)
MSRLLYQLSYPAEQWDRPRPIEPLPGIGPGTSPLPRERSANELKGLESPVSVHRAPCGGEIESRRAAFVRTRLTRAVPDAPAWTAADLPDLTGRRAVVTGANSGLGFHTARELAAHGAEVTLAVRTPDKGDEAAALIRAADPDARVEVGRLDLADLASIRAFADAWTREHPEGLDLLINNAGIMAIPRRLTADGFEMQLGTNHLGHYALTGLLLPALAARPRSRVVTVSSGAHRLGRMDFDDLMGERRYHPWRAYGQSKLANLLFTSELQRRLTVNGLPMVAVAAHPGYASTNLQGVGPRMSGRDWLTGPMDLANRILAQPAEMGALPTLFAATMPGLPGNSYVGPDGFMEQRGHPRLVGRSAAARRDADARRLWTVSQQLTGVEYPLDAA